jgi:hypothetical protein
LKSFPPAQGIPQHEADKSQDKIKEQLTQKPAIVDESLNFDVQDDPPSISPVLTQNPFVNQEDPLFEFQMPDVILDESFIAPKRPEPKKTQSQTDAKKKTFVDDLQSEFAAISPKLPMVEDRCLVCQMYLGLLQIQDREEHVNQCLDQQNRKKLKASQEIPKPEVEGKLLFII